MKESYPYFVLPQKVEKIKSEGIPLPPLPQLLPLPEQAKRKYIGTIIFIVSLVAFITLNVISQRGFIFYMFISFFIALISLVASIFEFVQYGKLKKQYVLDMKLYNENKEAFKKIKLNQEKIIQNNKDENLIKKYQQDKIKEFFNNTYDTINAIMNEYSMAKKRYKLFLEEYFPNEVLDNVRIIHSAKNLEYIPDFVIKFLKPKLNVAIEIEEPYSLSNVPENIQKDYDAKDRIRQRFANELGWIVVVISEEQAIKNPIECCKFIEDTIEYIFTDVRGGEQFANIQPIKKQRMLTGEERSHLKSSGYREKYLAEAGLMEDEELTNEKQDNFKTENEKKEVSNFIKEHTNKVQSEKIIVQETKLPIDDVKTPVDEIKTPVDDMKTPEDKKENIENEQLMLIKKVAQKVKPENGEKKEKELDQEPLKIKTEGIEKEISEQEKPLIVNNQESKSLEQEKPLIVDNQEYKSFDYETIEEEIPIIEENSISENPKVDLTKKGEQLRREDDILKDLYKALDKHSKKQQERKEKRIREKHIVNGKIEDIDKQEEDIDDTLIVENKSVNENSESPILENSDFKQIKDEQLLVDKQEFIEKVTIEENKTTETKEVEIIKTPKIESVTEENQLEKIEIDNSNNELDLVEDKLEEIESNKFIEESLKAQNILNEDAQKNQKLIDEYREKIEGAVFDKTWDELISICTEAIEVLPFWDWAYYRRSTAWGNKRDFEKVIEDCNRAVSYNPTLADAYYNRGTARFFTGRYRESADDYQKAIALNYIKKADAYFNKGLCYQKMEYHKKAYLEFMKAKELGSKKAEEVLRTQYD